MSEHLLTYALPAFISHFISSIILLLLFVTIYIRITPYKEITLIRSGNMAAAASLSGSILGYSIALASAIANSVNLQDMLIWGCIALLVQLFAYFAARVMLPGLVLDIPENKVASGIFLGAISLSMGLLNAASLTY
jgi:putative membrane protein